MVKKSGREKVVESKVQEPKELLTAKEFRSQIAKLFLDKRREVNEEIEKVQQDETMADEEKKVKIDELHKKLYDFIDVIQGNKDYWTLSEEVKGINKLADNYSSSYVKRFQIKEVEEQLENEKDPKIKKFLEKKLRLLKEFYGHTKYLKNKEVKNISEIIKEEVEKKICEKEKELISKKQMIDRYKLSYEYNANNLENLLKEDSFFEELCDIVKNNGLYVPSNWNGYDILKGMESYMSREMHSKFNRALEEGGGIKRISRIQFYPDIIRENGGLEEGESIGIECLFNNDYKDVERTLKAIKEFGGLKEGCHITIDFVGCRATLEDKNLVNSLIEDANKKGINSTISIWYDNDPYSTYNSGYGGSRIKEGMKEIKKKNTEKVKEWEQQNINKKPVLEINSIEYENIEESEENLEKIINIERKKLQDSIIYTYDKYKKVGMEEYVEEAVDKLIKKIAEFFKKEKGITLEMVGGTILGIGKEILEVYKHPYYLNQEPHSPEYLITDISKSPDGMIVETRYTSGVSGTRIETIHINDPDFSTQRYLVTKDGKCKLIKQGSYNLRDLYK